MNVIYHKQYLYHRKNIPADGGCGVVEVVIENNIPCFTKNVELVHYFSLILK